MLRMLSLPPPLLTHTDGCGYDTSMCGQTTHSDVQRRLHYCSRIQLQQEEGLQCLRQCTGMAGLHASGRKNAKACELCEVRASFTDKVGSRLWSQY